jgi:prenylcysteine alpha-carboxyl methylesterase
VTCLPWFLKNWYLTKTHDYQTVEYNGIDHRNTMNIYTPDDMDSNKKYPIVLFVHGGIWISGDKSLYHQLGMFMKSKGVICAVINYRLFPQGYLEDMIDDCDNAIDYLLINAGNLVPQADLNRVTLIGHSAGAHLLSCTLIRKVKQESKTQWNLNQIRNLMAMSGVYDLKTHYGYEKDRLIHIISPMWQVSKGVDRFPLFSPTLLLDTLSDQQKHLMEQEFPRTIILHGLHDIRCPFNQAKHFADALKQVLPEDQIQLITLRNFEHGDVITGFMALDPEHRRDEIWNYIEPQL